MNYNLLAHLDLEDAHRLRMACENIRNYNAALPAEKYQVVVLANGPAVKLFTVTDCPVADEVAELAAVTVSFRMCANALRKFGISPESLLPCCTVVPAGLVEIVHLQREGFAYIKP